MKKALFIDRDGTLIVEPPVTFQVDTLDQLQFLPGVITALGHIAGLDYELVMVTNQDGLGTAVYPQENFDRVQEKMLDILAGEGIHFKAIHIDRSFPEEGLDTRKPGTGLLTAYMDGSYDLAHSFVIGDRITDLQLAKNLGAKGILIQPPGEGNAVVKAKGLEPHTALVTDDWNRIYELLRLGDRVVTINRSTRETQIELTLDLDGRSESRISTGLHFFDHMLDQIAHHSGMSLQLNVQGDLEVDEHHTIEDTGIVLGEALRKSLGDKRGIERYGFSLPMDESDATVLIDFGGRIEFVWEVSFTRERIGDVPTELFEHFFKSLAQAARCNLHIRAAGTNEHHKIEGIFKAFSRAVRAAVRRNVFEYKLPSSKGSL